MLTTDLLSRALGSTSPFAFAQTQTSRQLLALQPAPRVRFDGGGNLGGANAVASAVEDFDGDGGGVGDGEGRLTAHNAGVNALVVDRFEGRYLLSGGADARVSMWDLEAADESGRRGTTEASLMYKPLGSVAKSMSSHKYGITALSFYPFDSLAFLSSSYDHSLKIYSSTTLTASASFDLTSVIYSHAISPISSHLLVACATQHPAIRLVDLHSGATTHSLVGHGGGAVMSVAWSPKEEYILASGGADGTVRFWDVRRSAGMLAVLDMEDSVGCVGYDKVGFGARRRDRGKAHAGAVNGVVWTDDGRHVVTTGHDERIRVWDSFSGANTLANFGPVVRNRHLSTLLPLVTPPGLTVTGREVLLYPNENEILMYEMLEGKLLKRLRAPAVASTSSAGARNAKNRVTALAWRAHSIELLSAHSDGTIRSWQSRTRIDAFVDEQDKIEDEESETEVGSMKRKRKVLDDIYREVTGQRVTFS